MIRYTMISSMGAILLIFTSTILTKSIPQVVPVLGGDFASTQTHGTAGVSNSMVSGFNNEVFRENLPDFQWLFLDRTQLAPVEPLLIPCDDTIEVCTYLPLILKPLTPPDAFGKTTPTNGANGQSINLTLDWADASGATSYEYCYDGIPNGVCTGGWVSTLSTSQAGPLSLANNQTYDWQVRANNASGTATYADGGTVWSFTTVAAWSIITSEDFEGSFPQTGWSRTDKSSLDEGVNIIGKRDCKVYSGSYSGWMVGIRNGTERACATSYSNNSDTWFIYGPFSTVGATAGLLNFNYYTCMTDTVDRLYVRITDNYSATTWQGFPLTGCGTTSFRSDYLDLSVPRCLGGTASCLNLPSVYVAFQFISDSTTTNQYGAVLDNIVLKLCMGGSCTASPPAIDNTSSQSDTIRYFLGPFVMQFIGFGSLTLPE
jgi:hypothetical protein